MNDGAGLRLLGTAETLASLHETPFTRRDAVLVYHSVRSADRVREYEGWSPVDGSDSLPGPERFTLRFVAQVLYTVVRRPGHDARGVRGDAGRIDGVGTMSLRSTVLRSLLVVVAGGFTAAGKVTGAASGSASGTTDEEAGTGPTMTPPTPLGPPASAGRQAVLTGVGPGPKGEGDD